MALVEKMEKISLGSNSRHTKVNCTYSIVTDDDGRSVLQVDTYGSEARQIKGKKSQSIRFSPEAIRQLKGIIEKEFSLG